MGGVNTNGHSYVDLGLPSGTLWATMNVGATSETDYGDYFMWGETTPNTVYDWKHYKYCNGSYTTLTKYCTDSYYGTVDNKTTIDPEDDAATQIMGGDWRMPTQAEFNELLNGTTNEWIADYKGTGVNGRKFTSKTDESKYIFIPAAGFCVNDSVFNVGSSGSVWSSSISASHPDGALYLSFSSGNCGMDSAGRCSGRSVRGVCK